MDIAINPDGSGSLELEIEISQEFIQGVMGSLESNPLIDTAEPTAEDACDQFFSSMGPLGIPFVNPTLSGIQLEWEMGETADGTHCRIFWRVEWGSEHADRIFITYLDNGGPIVKRVSPVGWRLEIPLESEDIDESDRHFEGSTRLTATLPGKSVAHNADRVSSSCRDSTFYWEVGLYGPPDPLIAETDGTDECKGGWGAGPVVAVVFLGVLATSMVAALLIRRSRRSRVQSGPWEPAGHI